MNFKEVDEVRDEVAKEFNFDSVSYGMCEGCGLYCICDCIPEPLPLESVDLNESSDENAISQDHSNIIPPIEHQREQRMLPPPPIVHEDQNTTPQAPTTVFRMPSPRAIIEETEEETENHQVSQITCRICLVGALKKGDPDKREKKKVWAVVDGKKVIFEKTKDTKGEKVFLENTKDAKTVGKADGDIKRINEVRVTSKRIGTYEKKTGEIRPNKKGVKGDKHQELKELFKEVTPNQDFIWIDEKTFGFTIGFIGKTSYAIKRLRILIDYEALDGRQCKVVFSYLYKVDSKKKDHIQESSDWYSLEIEEDGLRFFTDDFDQEKNVIKTYRQQRQRQTNNVVNQNVQQQREVQRQPMLSPSKEFLYDFYLKFISEVRGQPLQMERLDYQFLLHLFSNREQHLKYCQQLQQQQQRLQLLEQKQQQQLQQQQQQQLRNGRVKPLLNEFEVPEKAVIALSMNPSQQLPKRRVLKKRKRIEMEMGDKEEENRNEYSPARKKRKVE